jgi:hypothetical protein
LVTYKINVLSSKFRFTITRRKQNYILGLEKQKFFHIFTYNKDKGYDKT